jgi:hypothetical protein
MAAGVYNPYMQLYTFTYVYIMLDVGSGGANTDRG